MSSGFVGEDGDRRVRIEPDLGLHGGTILDARGAASTSPRISSGIMLAMSPTQLLERAQRRLNSLTPERLRVAEDFLAYLEAREADEATGELLAMPGFLDQLKRAEEEVEAGQLTPVEDLRRSD